MVLEPCIIINNYYIIIITIIIITGGERERENKGAENILRKPTYATNNFSQLEFYIKNY
jgi:hypothetical protein